MALIEDHFLSDQVEEDWPESDSEDEMENAQDVCDIENEKEDDVVEEAVVHIEGAAGYNCAETVCNGAPMKPSTVGTKEVWISATVHETSPCRRRTTHSPLSLKMSASL